MTRAQESAPGRSGFGAAVLGSASMVVCTLPVFLTGAMVVQINEDVAFGAAGLGLAVALNRGGQAASSIYLGPLTDRLGANSSLRLAMVIAAIASIGIATTATSLVALCAWLVFASFAHALAQTGSNRLLVRRVRANRLGTAFGVKQAAPPTASMLAGLAVPAVALTLGWRWAYVFGALLASTVFVALGGQGRTAEQRRAQRSRESTPREPLRDLHVVVLMSVAFGFALASNAAVPTFYVASAVDVGARPAAAGTWLAVSSAMVIVVRLAAGFACDRFVRRPLMLCAVMVAAGAVGLGLLASGRPGLMMAGVVAALAGAWGFNGVFWFATVRAYADTPGRVTGWLAPGGSLGATLGALAFGWIAEASGFAAAWLTAGGAALLAAVSLAVSSRMLGESRHGPV